MTGRRTVLSGGRVLWPDGTLAPGTLVLDGERIAELRAAWPGSGTLPEAADLHLDVTGCVVAPGFVDTHVHGGLGANFMAADDDAVRRISTWLAAGGVTSCLAATASVGLDRLETSLRGLSGRRGRLGGDGVQLLGTHLEGPFISPRFSGVHRPEHLLAPTPEAVEAILTAAGDSLRVVTLAPELPGGLDAVATLTAAGVRVSLGHTAATYDEARQAVELGLRRVTHLFNALPPIHHRAPGPIPAVLTDARVDLELVADGIHLAPEMIRFATDVAGADRIILVSDGTDVAGLPAGPQRRWEGTEVEVGEDAARTTTGRVAGSVARLGDGVRIAVRRAGIGLATALRMASANPARSLGLTDRGKLAPGMLADVVVLGPELDVQATFVHGDRVFTKEEQT